MTLIGDNLENVKASILVAIKNELTETYPSEFGDYTTGKGDVRSKVYWSDTVRYQPRYPYCQLIPTRDKSAGLDETRYIHNETGVLCKRTISRSYLDVTFDVTDMGNEQLGKSSLKADTFAHKVARQLRKYFNGDAKLSWFSGNSYFNHQIGINVLTDIDANIDWADTDTVFKYSFTVRFGWNDINDTPIDKAKGAEVRTSVNGNVFDVSTFDIISET